MKCNRILFVCGLFILAFLTQSLNTSTQNKSNPDRTAPEPKIQAAILLDVSNSMDGLIEQAKAQLWNMVTVMNKARCDGKIPRLEIAIYEYGRSTNDVSKGYVKQISPFSNDLDKLSASLFSLTTKGGNEFCGQVILTSLQELPWDPSSNNYKVIFIAGNESFLQGNVSFTQACTEAEKKGVIVNTIYCGDRDQGIREHWNLGSECGKGSFTNIDNNEKPIFIPTPYDSTLLVLNVQLNNTYIYYGSQGKERHEMQSAMDSNNETINKTVAVNRTAVKGNASLYNNSTWDLVDAYKDDKKVVDQVEMKTLPENLRNLSRAQLKTEVEKRQKERTGIQQEIGKLNSLRNNFIQEKKKEIAGQENKYTLEQAIEQIIREQAGRANMKIE